MFRGPVFLMRSHLSLSLALATSVLAHAAVLLAGPGEPVIGRNVPAMTHPVRMRLLGVRPAPPVPSALAGSDPTLAPAVAALPSAAPEGRIDAEQTNFAESSARYFTREELDVRPTVVDPPDLGAMELSPLLEGRAVLVFYLNEYGAVDRIVIEQSTLPPSMLAQLEAQQAQIKFTPGNKNGVAVKSVVRFEIALAKAAEKIGL